MNKWNYWCVEACASDFMWLDPVEIQYVFLAFIMGDIFMVFCTTLKALCHLLQKEQEVRVGDLGLRGTINMGGMDNTF